MKIARPKTIAVSSIAILIGALAFISARDGDPGRPSPQPTPAPSIQVVSGELRVVAIGSPNVVDRARTELSALLNDFYSRAFLPPFPAPRIKVTPRPTPIARPDPIELVAEPSRPAFEAARETFSPGPGARVNSGQVSFDGSIFAEGDAIYGAVISIALNARGTLRGDSLVLTQTGQLTVVPTPVGWRITDFDVVLNASREIPVTPIPNRK